MKTIVLIMICLTVSVHVGFAQNDGVGIGTTSIADDAIFQVESTNKGILIPRVNNRTDVTAVTDGLIVYDKSAKGLFIRYENAWHEVGSPSGTIVMWSGTTPPNGWALCNGANGTPNLRGRFVVGYDPGDGDYNGISKTGGAENVTLTAAQSGLPAHSHNIEHNHGVTDGRHSHSQWIHGGKAVGSGNGETAAKQGLKSTRTESTSTNFSNITVNDFTGDSQENASVGATSSHENRPPYYVLAYIMKL